MSAMLALIEQEFTEIVPRVLRDEPVKVVALRTGVTPRAVKTWRAGDNSPSLPSFLMLARQFPELKAAVKRWLELEGNFDPEAQRLLSEMVAYLQRRT